MKAPREYKAWVRRLVKVAGKKNGVVQGALFDSPKMEMLLQTSKRKHSRKHIVSRQAS